MRLVIVIGLLFVCFHVQGQRIKTSDALFKSDSILKAKTGILFENFKTSPGSYCRIRTSNERISTGKFLNSKLLSKNIVSINFLYHFDYEPIKGVNGSTWVILDHNLNLIDTIALDFIPTFLKEGNPSTFISKKKALEVALNSFSGELNKLEDFGLGYKPEYKKYVYTFGNNMSDNYVEVVHVDATTSEVLKIYEGLLGIKIR